jgi:hypothetical protein
MERKIAWELLFISYCLMFDRRELMESYLVPGKSAKPLQKWLEATADLKRFYGHLIKFFRSTGIELKIGRINLSY